MGIYLHIFSFGYVYIYTFAFEVRWPGASRRGKKAGCCNDILHGCGVSMCEDCAVADSMFFMLFSSVVNRETVRLKGGTGKVVLTIDFQ